MLTYFTITNLTILRLKGQDLILKYAYLFQHQLYILKMFMKNLFRGGQWERQFKEITKLLKNSIDAADSYSRNIFDSQQQFLSKFSQEYMGKLKKIESICFEIRSKKFFNQLVQKLNALTSLFFPTLQIDAARSQIKIKHKRIERLLRIIQKQQLQLTVKIGSEIIRSLLQEQSKLNMDFQLFVFKCFILSDSSDPEVYRPSNPPLCLKQPSFPNKSKINMKIIHGYFQQEAAKIILSNLPTLGSYKTVFNKALESKQVKELKDKANKDGQPGKSMGEDNNENSKICFNYFGHAMQFDFFNSLVQPLSLSNYLRRFTIIEDRTICQALILGALSSLPNDEEPQFSDTDQQDQWEEQVQKNSQEFCSFFEAYFEEEESSGEVKAVATRIAALRRKKKDSLPNILKRFWCK